MMLGELAKPSARHTPRGQRTREASTRFRSAKSLLRASAIPAIFSRSYLERRSLVCRVFSNLIQSVVDLFEPPLFNTTFTSSLRRIHMAKLGRFTPIRVLAFGVLALASTSWAQTRSPIAEQIAKAYGLDSYDQVEAIRYTFNIRGAISVTRSWVWEPKTGQISYEGVDKDGKPVKVTFVQSKVTPDSPIAKDKIDWFFVNDNYWAFLPFHLHWDSSGV